VVDFRGKLDGQLTHLVYVLNDIFLAVTSNMWFKVL
jgi:hypothetical protein